MDGNPNPSLPPNSSSPPQEFRRQLQAALKRRRPHGAQLNITAKRSAAAQVKVMNKSVDFPTSQCQSANASVAGHEMECLASSLPEASTGFNQKVLVSEGSKISLVPKKTVVAQDNLLEFKNFLSQPGTQSSIVGSSCATTTSVHSTSAPMLNSLTRSSHSHANSVSNVAAEPCKNVNPHPTDQGVIKSVNSIKDTHRISTDQATSAVQVCKSLTDAELTFKESHPSKEQHGCILKETSISKYSSCQDGVSTKGKESAVATNTQPEAPTVSSDVKVESAKFEKPDKAASSKVSTGTRKRTYDPDMFFKVSDKLYQKLGRIGSGGSSEVYKVISSDCTIYALKKIKLKGRDYATAYGFCQEIEYLNRLKGKNNIIQLIDYEVTDKALRDGSFNSKDGRVKDDGYIYMVLEYGEIDLAHMLSQKWKELNGCNQTIDENWLRFYWQLGLASATGAVTHNLLRLPFYGDFAFREIRVCYLMEMEKIVSGNTSGRCSQAVTLLIIIFEIIFSHSLFYMVSNRRLAFKQILQAVNTIHEERIVHSDLKPANFLLVKGSLKLIDFGIAKAIMSDTTNIQRDAQVGTLNYMSPEAFLCNESDANGNIIKCGRPSDIWSLGCILYQMVYGRTPFSDYQTFWAKVKVISDPNHKIKYEPVSNPWLVDLMKKCLAWDRNERWRIPRLLQHPFLAPPVQCHPSPSQDKTFKLLRIIAETCTHDPEALQLCSQIQQVISDPFRLINPDTSNSRDQQHTLLSKISELCVQLQERLKNIDIGIVGDKGR